MSVSATRTARFALAAVALAAFVLVGALSPVTARARADTAPTVVSLTFDDGVIDQYTNALPVLQQHGMHGTFYIITGYIGVNPGYMTLPQLQALSSAGNEIAGHTVLHPFLTQVNSDEATREVCQSRDTLLNWGFQATDFAYPYSDYNAAVEGIVKHCGFNTAREDSDLKSPFGCSDCDVAESIPPADPYAVRAPASITTAWTLSDLEQQVIQAENGGGGWVPLVFHHICDSACDSYSVSPATFSSFLSWLQTQQNVSVKTVSQVTGGSVQPAVTAPSAAPAPPGTNGVANPSLENADMNNAGFPACWVKSNSGSNSASYSLTGGAHTGSAAQTLTVTSFASGDAKLIIKQDLGECAPSAVPGDSYQASAWYKSTAPTRLVFWYRDADGGWHYWTQSPQFAAAGSWTQAIWATPAVPAGAVALSFGLNIAANGTLTTDDYSLMDSGGAPASPAVSLTSPSGGSTLSGQITFGANASSPVGISRVDYLVNGTVVATGTSGPSFAATWDSSAVGDGPVTITARATDNGGNQTTSSGVSAAVSNASSRGGNLLANASLETSTAGGVTPDCWQLGGTGTNTFNWSRSGSAHSGNWAQNVTISSYTSGDRKLVTSQAAGACSPRVTAGRSYSLGAWYQANQPTHLVAYYLNASGSWVYWTQSPAFAASSTWAQASWATPPLPSGATALSFGLNLAASGSLTTDDYTMTGP